jgi:16S rRNA (uracil1498-N3)-methyltransferase
MRSTDARPPFFVADAADLAGELLVLDGPEGRHAATVRRLAEGDEAWVTDGAGTVARCRVTAVRRDELTLAIVGREVEPPPAPALIVVQALPKGDRGELAVGLLTEVGADVVVPWAAERCVVRWRGDRAAKSLARWRSAAVAAAKQSRRGRFPDVWPCADLYAVTGLVKDAALAIVLDPAARHRLAALEVPATGQIVLIVGPEGGVAPAEQTALVAAGATRARLGPSVLRTSTAGAIAAGLLLSRTNRWQ